MPTLHAQSPLPQGVVDLLFEDAAGKRDLEQRLRRIFCAWSYDELTADVRVRRHARLGGWHPTSRGDVSFRRPRRPYPGLAA